MTEPRKLKLADCGHWCDADIEAIGVDAASPPHIKPRLVFLCSACAEYSGLSQPKSPRLTTKGVKK